MEVIGALGWPMAVVVIVVVFLLIFKRPLERLLDRTREVTRSGLKAGGAEDQQQQQQADADGLGDLEEIAAAVGDEVLAQLAARVEGQIEQNLSQEAGERGRQWADYAARLQLALHSEKSYRLIWGSQLHALTHLNSRPAGSPAGTLKSLHFDQAPLADTYQTFDGWLGFLRQQGFVEQLGEQVKITPLGRAFLQYLIQEGLSFEKPL